MNEFKKLNGRFDRLEHKIDDQTSQITHVIRDSQLTQYLSPLEATNGIYDAFVQKDSKFHFDELKNQYQSTTENVRGLERVIGQYFESFMNVHGNFGALFDVYTDIVAKLSKLNLAFGVGCIQRCKTNNRSDSECTSSCFEDDPM